MNTKRYLGCLAAALLACVASTPALAKDEVPTAHGGRMVDMRGGQLEVVHDGPSNTITVYATQPDQKPLVLKSSPELVLSARTPNSKPIPAAVTFDAVVGTPGAWRTDCPSDQGWSAMSLSVRVNVDGSSELVALSSKPRVSRGVLIFGDEALRLEVTSDEPKGSVSFRPLTAEDAMTLGEAVPQVIVTRNGSEETLTTTRGGDERDTYVLSGKTSLRNAQDVIVRVMVAGRNESAKLVLIPDATRGIHGGSMVTFGDPVAGQDAQLLEVVHDATAGTLTICQPDAVGQSALSKAPMVVLTTASGPKTLEAVAVRDVEGAWKIQAPELKAERLDGVLQVRVEEETLEVALPGMLPAGAKPANG